MKVTKIAEEESSEVELNEKNSEDYISEYEGLVIKDILKRALADGVITIEEHKYLEMNRMEKYDREMLNLMSN